MLLMVKIRTIQVRLTRQQYDQIMTDSTAKGFSTLSAYFRYLALYRDQSILKKILEIHESVVSKKLPRRTAKNGYNDETLRKAL